MHAAPVGLSIRSTLGLQMRLLPGSLPASCQDLLLSDVWIGAGVRLARVLDQQMTRNLLMRELCGRSQCDVTLHSWAWSLAIKHPRNNLVVLSHGCTTALLAYGKEFIWGSLAEQLVVFYLLELRSFIFLIGQVDRHWQRIFFFHDLTWLVNRNTGVFLQFGAWLTLVFHLS